MPHSEPRIDRRVFLGTGALAASLACSTTHAADLNRAATNATPGARDRQDKVAAHSARKDFPVLIGSANALPGMQRYYANLQSGGDPLDVAIDVVKVAEADPSDTSVGLGGLPNEDGVVQLDAACMYGPWHKSGAVACIENILHPSEVARLVLERTDHCVLVGRGAYEFARAHGHPHTELLTESTRRLWMEWKESLSSGDDWLAPPAGKSQAGRPLQARGGVAGDPRPKRSTGTIHCSALSTRGQIACTTTTSGLAFKIPGRVGDSPIVGAGLYCDQEAGSAGATGRGEASILANGSFAAVELMRQGATPLEAGLEVLRRVVRQAQRLAIRQGEMVDEHGLPSFGLNYYVLGLDGTFAGVTLKQGGEFAVADPVGGPRLLPLVAL